MTPPTLATTGLPAIVVTNVLPILAPESATVRLFAKCRRVSLDGISSIIFPYIAPGVLPVYVIEGGPMPVVKRSTTGTKLGPPKKILVGAGISEELEQAGPEPASVTIGRAIDTDIRRSLDSTTFDNAADDGTRPAGLLNGVTPITSTAGGGLNALDGDAEKSRRGHRRRRR